MNKNWKEFLKNLKNLYTHPGHDITHIKRVYKNALMIAKSVKCDIDIVKAAALLHDVSRGEEWDGKIKDHASEGAKRAKKILEKTNFPKEKISAVCYAIKVHRFRKGIKARTIEAKILQDADRLDALGAIIVTRMLRHNLRRPIYDPKIKPREKYIGPSTTVYNHFIEKISKITPESFHTKTAQKIAEHRYEFVVSFFKELVEEFEGRR
jgi:uncharacterized protein